ncbi:hypothetical protein EV421DRAFT_1740054 [Armillaria borealis]|uniref:Uncharacterized protein n=1 Tax=Armillaria borealis TaxID=47425 RepID=A0AA39J446_9AGAR|nr:hypothetical protein EV421DRAFT_1740054 [Armillaria borealis]
MVCTIEHCDGTQIATVDFFPKTRKWRGTKGSKRGANKKGQDSDEGEGASPPPWIRLRFGTAPINNLSDSGSDSSTANIPSFPDTATTTKKELAARTQDAQDAYANMSPSKNLNRDEALSEVDVTKFKELPSYPWQANSCWLDASLEALYSALNYGDWNGFEILFNEDMNWTPPSLTYYFYLTMRGHRSWPISTFSVKNGPVQELQTLRDGFRTFLYKMKVVEGPEDSYQDGLGWFQGVIAPRRSHVTNEKCKRYFTLSYRTIELCLGHSSDPTLADHIKVHRASRECAVVDKPWIQDFEMHQGKIKTWFNFLTHMATACKGTAVSCWRGKHCSSEAISVKLWTWIPIILTIEPANMAGQSHLDFVDLIERNWDFPCTLAPLTLREAKEKGLEYVVVSRIFKNHNHFITRSIVPTPGGKPVVFTYDGMKHAGFSQLERGSIDDLMTGSSPPVPKGYHTYAVIYRLHGGPSAQDYFASHQLELIQKKLHVNLVTPSFLLPGFREMAENERVWVTSHYSSQPRSWEFCRSQPKPVHKKNIEVKSGKEKETKHLSVPPISALPDDFDTEDQVENDSNND